MKRTDKVTVTIPVEVFLMLMYFLRTMPDERMEFIKKYVPAYYEKFPEPENENQLYKDMNDLADGIFGCHYSDVTFNDDTKSVKLNDELSAEIGEGTVKVGCQTFTHDAVKKLYKAIENSKK